MRLAEQLIAQRLVACAQLWPIQSVYRWEGQVQSEAEVLLQAKTTKAQLAAVQTFVVEHHSYEIPEVVAMPVVGGHPAYLDWVVAQMES